MFNTILFDLDGTLTNPYMGITGGILYALENMGRELPPRESLKCFIGPPLHDSFRDFCGMNEAEIKEAIGYQREYYNNGGLLENELIEGAVELLAELKRRGKTVCIATSKPLKFAEIILRHFEIYDYFDYVGGATLDGKIGTKAEVLRLVLSETGAKPSECLMVGDTKYDIDGAHQLSIKCAAVPVGFGTREEFREHNADFISEKLLDILKIV